MTMYVYKTTYPKSDQPPLYEVGFYSPRGVWYPESYHALPELAAFRVHWLNGGSGDTDAAGKPDNDCSVTAQVERIDANLS